MTMPTPDNDEQQPGRWGSNRFIVILLGIVLGFAVVNLYSSWRAWTSPASATALSREI